MDWSKFFAVLFQVVPSTIVQVLHISGADKHKTIAGQIATGLATGGVVVQALHDTLTENPPAVGQSAISSGA